MATIYIPDGTLMDAVMANNGNEKQAKREMKDVLDRAYTGQFHKADTHEDTAGPVEVIRNEIPEGHDYIENANPTDYTLATPAGDFEGELTDTIVIENLDADAGISVGSVIGRAEIRIEDIPETIEALRMLHDELSD